MLLIFDLDDTLIDTSGSITPFKMQECLKGFVSEGVKIPDFEKAYQTLMALNETSTGSQEALLKFLQYYHADLGLMQFAQHEMNSPLPADFTVLTTPNAKETLEAFQKTHILALVTGGNPKFQMEKLEKAGIDRSIFSKIAIPEDSVKKPFYEGLIQEFSVSADMVLVCGDRIAMDLAPAHALGCKTVHMRWGRGKRIKVEDWITHSISTLSELKGIVKKL